MNGNIGIDLGSFSARMSVKGRGLVLRQSSAGYRTGGHVVELGNDAYRYLGRAARGSAIVYPFQNGVIADEEALAEWLSYMIRQALSSGLVNRPRVLIARPAKMAHSQMRRVVATALDSGATQCALIRSDLCAAMGAGLDITQPRAHLVVEFGAGMMTATLIALGAIVACETLPFGVSSADDLIARMIRARYGLMIGPHAAEVVKASLATAPATGALKEQVAGLDCASGFPRAVMVETQFVREALNDLITQAVQLVLATLDRADTDMLVDLMDGGVVLTGGGALMSGLEGRVAEATGLKCRVADDPSLCVARGLEEMLINPEPYERLMEAHQTILDKRLPGVKR